MITREELPADVGEAYKKVENLLTANRDEERHLLALRGRLLNELVGRQRGGRTRAAELLGVSDVHIGRLLAEDLVRAVHAAMEAAGWRRTDYVLNPGRQKVPPEAQFSLRLENVRGDVNRLNAAGAALNTLLAAGFAYWDLETNLSMDVGNDGPWNTLAEEMEICVSWPDED